MLIDDGFAQLPVIAAASVASPPAGFVKTFFDSSNANRLSQKDSSGAVIDLAATGSGGFTNTIISGVGAVPAGNQQNWALSGLTGYNTVKAVPADNSFIGGIAAGTDGQIVNIVNSSASGMIWLTNEDSESTAANRLLLPKSGTFLLPGDSVQLVYDSTSSRWRQTAVSFDNLGVDDKSVLVVPNTTTSVLSIGRAATLNTATLSTNAAAATPSNDFTDSPNTQITNATANGSSDVRLNVNSFMRGADAGRHGIFFNARFRNTALGATGGFICGLTNSTAAITTQPRNTNNTIGIGTHGGETTHRVYSRDATAATAVDLGANFPANNATAAYELALFCPSATASVRYMVRRLDSEFKTQGTITTNLPANNATLGSRIGVSVGATAAATTAQFTRMFTRSVS